MEEYTKVLKDYLSGKRDYTKTMFKISGTIYRGVTRGRFAFDEGINAINELGGTNQ